MTHGTVVAYNYHKCRCSVCTTVWRDYYRDYKRVLRASRRKMIEEYLQAQVCADCGIKDTIVFDFDHARGDKIGNISVMKNNSSLELLLKELQKCDVVCANCHRRRTAGRAEIPWLRLGGVPEAPLPVEKESVSLKEKARIKQWNHRLKNRLAMIAFLTDHGCKDCGEQDPIVLEFDHLRDKDFCISGKANTNIAHSTLIAEFQKCDVVCVNCHRRRTYSRNLDLH